METLENNQMEHQIKYVSSLPILPLKIEDNNCEYQSIVVRSEKTMYIYFCGELVHKIFNLPTFNVDKMSDVFLKACSLSNSYYNITADYKFVISEYNLMVEGNL